MRRQFHFLHWLWKEIQVLSVLIYFPSLPYLLFSFICFAVRFALFQCPIILLFPHNLLLFMLEFSL
jgi:hypothetical protein